MLHGYNKARGRAQVSLAETKADDHSHKSPGDNNI